MIHQVLYFAHPDNQMGWCTSSWPSIRSCVILWKSDYSRFL